MRPLVVLVASIPKQDYGGILAYFSREQGVLRKLAGELLSCRVARESWCVATS